MPCLDELAESVGAQIFAPGLGRVALRTPTLPPATHTNAYLLGGQRVLWVEPASEFADEVERSLRIMARLEEQGVRFEGYFLTHHHADHVGGLLAMSERKPLPVWAHPCTHARVAADPRCARVEIVDGDLRKPFSDWTAIHTPGHAPGHLCLHRSSDGQLIAGDMVAETGTILIDSDDGDMTQYLDSLAVLNRLGAQWVYPAHGERIARERLVFEHYIEHRLSRERRVVQALETKPQSVSELLPRCYAETPQPLWPLAERSLLAHLKKLMAEGRAECDKSGWRSVKLD